jgi:GNAT superfamily N-acetyltransferase
MSSIHARLEFHPLTIERWDDFVELFGEHGAYGGCWCMWWRLTRREFNRQQGAGNRRAMRAIVESEEVPGILAYRQGNPVGWCSVAPRHQFGALERSRVLKRLDDLPVWSIVCFYVAKEHRGEHVAMQLIQASLKYVRDQGGEIVEAYPTVPKTERVAPISSFMGFPSMFKRAGFHECARPSQRKIIMRCVLT